MRNWDGTEDRVCSCICASLSLTACTSHTLTSGWLAGSWVYKAQSLLTRISPAVSNLSSFRRLYFFLSSSSTAAPESVAQREMHQPCARHKPQRAVEGS